MKFQMKAVSFILIFSLIEVAQALVTMPLGCLGQKSACAVKTSSDTFRSKSLISAELFLYHNTSVFVDSTGYLFLLEGTIRSKATKQVQIRSIFADFSFAGDVYFRGEKDRILVRNVSGEVKITLRDGKEMVLPEGFEIWVAGLDMNKTSSIGVYRKLNLKEHIRLWSLSFEGNKASFLRELNAYRAQYLQAQKNEIELYRGVAGEMQSRFERGETARELRAVKEKQEDAARRKLFFDRTFFR